MSNNPNHYSFDRTGVDSHDFDEIPLRDLGNHSSSSAQPSTEPPLRNKSSKLTINTSLNHSSSEQPPGNHHSPFLAASEQEPLQHHAESSNHFRHSFFGILGNDENDHQNNLNETSPIFRDSKAIDLAKGLRNALGGDSWLTGRSALHSPAETQNTPFSSEEPSSTQQRPNLPRLSSDFGTIYRHSSTSQSSNPHHSIHPSLVQRPARTNDHNYLSAARLSATTIHEPTTPTDLEQDAGFFTSPYSPYNTYSSPSAHIARPVSPRANISKAFQKFSHRITTGDTDVEDAHSLRDSYRPLSMSNNRRSNDEDVLTSLKPLMPPKLPPKVPLKPVNHHHSNAPASDMSSPLLGEGFNPSASTDSSANNAEADNNLDTNELSPAASNLHFPSDISSINGPAGAENRFSSSAGVLTDDYFAQDTSYEPSTAQQETSEYQATFSKPTVELVGKSLFIFKKTNKFRIFLYKLLDRQWVKIFFTVFIMLHLGTLTGLTIPDIYQNRTRLKNTFFSDKYYSVFGWINFGIFVFYSLHSLASIIAYGLIFDSANETVDISFRNKRYRILTMPNTDSSDSSAPGAKALRSSRLIPESNRGALGGNENNPAIYNQTLEFSNKASIAPKRAYLRSTWRRIDMVAIFGFWISLILQSNEEVNKLELYIFRALSGLPILRLLNLTKRMSAILRSLKVGSTRIITIFLFIAFFLTLFSIIGSQSYHESLSRTCVWTNPENSSDTYNNQKFCGSYIDPTDLSRVPFITRDGSHFSMPKGYTCPVSSVCQITESPYDNTLNFDNFLNSLEIVFVIMSMNTFSDIMYKVIDSENMLSCLFFIVGIIILAYGLASLFISIIASTFKVIRNDIDSSDDLDAKIEKLFIHRKAHEAHLCRTKVGKIYFYLRDLPLLIILVDLCIQCTVTANSSSQKLFNIYIWEIVVASFFVVEIAIRFLLYLPKTYYFFTSKFNITDLILAIVNVIIILPFVHNHTVAYQWLSIFQILRFYRIVLTIRSVRDMWVRVLGQARMIFDVTLFYYIFIYIASILACLLLQGVIPTQENGGGSDWTFQSLANSFVAMYIISSTENWSSIMYNAIQFTESAFARACVGLFFCSWLVMSNFVTINMFIAVLSENLELSITSKRMEQIFIFFKEEIRLQSDFSARQTKDGLKFFLRYLTPRSNKSDDDKAVFEKVVMMLKDTNISNFLTNDPNDGLMEDARNVELEKNEGSILRFLMTLYTKLRTRFVRKSPEVTNFRGLEEYITYIRAQSENEKDQILKDPNYNKSLHIFSADNKIRKFCQKLVGPSYGIRFEGQNQPTMLWNIVWVFMILATVGLIVVAVIVTPIYYRENLQYTKYNWYIFTEATFLAIFTAEVVVKVIADGLIYAPNAYLKSVWGIIDFFVWISLAANFIQELVSKNKSARIIGAFKALRALRLLTISTRAQDIFNDVIIRGIWKLFSASIVALSLLFPYAVWGLNIFKGKMMYCNDGSISGSLNSCVGEYLNTPYNWEVKSPRVVSNKYYDFDTFGGSFLILFEIISLEGWTDVLVSSMSITGIFTQPNFDISNLQGIFFIAYNTLSTVFIMTLFLSVIIQNYAKSSGTAYFTDKQRMWYELEKSLKTVRPSIRPYLEPGTLRYKLFKQFTTPRSNTHLIMFGLLVGIIAILISEYYPTSLKSDIIRMIFLTVFIFAYLIFVLLKLYAFGTKRFFRRKWDRYALCITLVSFAFKIADYLINDSYSFLIAEKLFYVAMVVLIIPYSRRLDQLLKTAAASLPNMSHLLLVWLVLYFAYGIAFNQIFGITKIGPNGSTVINFRTVPNALVLLFRMSCGEGWNQILDDYIMEAPLCFHDKTGTDCGNRSYALFLFISWNILSLFIFANILVSLIYEQFSYLARPEEPAINRDRIRQFKDSWCKFDPDSKGYIDKADLSDFMYSLDGYFSMRIYREPWSLQSILYDSKCVFRAEIDVNALRQHMRKYPKYEIAQRRERCEQFYYHAMELADNKGHISFHSLLLLFPFYNDMDYNECLNIRDYLHYTNILETIRKKQHEDKVLGYKRMVLEMLKLQKALREKRREEYERGTGMAIPEFRVDMVDVDEEGVNQSLGVSKANEAYAESAENRRLIESHDILGNTQYQRDVEEGNDDDDLYNNNLPPYSHSSSSAAASSADPPLTSNTNQPQHLIFPAAHEDTFNYSNSQFEASSLTSRVSLENPLSLSPSESNFQNTQPLPSSGIAQGFQDSDSFQEPLLPEENKFSSEFHRDEFGFADLNNLALRPPSIPAKIAYAGRLDEEQYSPNMSSRKPSTSGDDDAGLDESQDNHNPNSILRSNTEPTFATNSKNSTQNEHGPTFLPRSNTDPNYRTDG